MKTYGMNVGELIEDLKQYSADLPVFVIQGDESTDIVTYTGPTTERIILNGKLCEVKGIELR